MGLFKKSELKVKSDNINGVTNFNIDYSKIKDIEKFKASLFENLLGNNLCLAIIDSKLQYKELNSSIEELIASFEDLNISYKKKIIKEDETVKVLGISMKVSSSTKAKRQMLGIVISPHNIQNIMEITKAYNTYYYFHFNKTENEELLDKVELYFNDEEELFNSFQLNLFDSIPFKNLNIKVTTKYFNYVNDIINNLK